MLDAICVGQRFRRTAVVTAVPLTVALGSASAAVAQTTGDVTFARDVAPIIQQKCQVCHQPNSIAPMSFTSYEQVVRYSKRIRARVAARVMPPWHIDKTVGIRD